MASYKKVYSICKNQIISDYTEFVKRSDGVIVRLGYRGSLSGNLVKDRLFTQHVYSLKLIHAPIGVYFFTNAINEAEAEEEAEFIVNSLTVNDVPLQFPIFINTDYAINDQSGRADCLTKETRTTILLTLIRKLKELGFKSALYAHETWFNSNLDLNQTLDLDKLCIKLDSKTKPKVNENLIGWEYTSVPISDIVEGKDYKAIKYYGEISPEAAKEPVEVIEEPVEEISEESESAFDIRVPGTELQLEEVDIYDNSLSSNPIANISGTYYTWDNKILRDRIRITDSKDKVGVNNEYTGWVYVDDVVPEE